MIVQQLRHVSKVHPFINVRSDCLVELDSGVQILKVYFISFSCYSQCKATDVTYFEM